MLRVTAIVLTILASAAAAKGETVEFVVNPELSQWSMRGAYFREGEPQGDLFPQSVGNEITSLTGVLRVELTENTIQFLPGSFLNAMPQPDPQVPGIDGVSGAVTADYGMIASTLPEPVPVFGVRDFAFTIVSDPILLVEFQSRRQFAESLTASMDFRIDYDLGDTAGSVVKTNWSRGFDDDHVARLVTEGGVQRIEIQNYLGEIFGLQSPGDSFFEWSGPIVATRVVPEPNGWSLGLCSAAGLGLWGMLNGRKR